MPSDKRSSITAITFFPDDPSIQVHQSLVCNCPPSFPNDLYWYIGKRLKPGRPKKQLPRKLDAIEKELNQQSSQELDILEENDL